MVHCSMVHWCCRVVAITMKCLVIMRGQCIAYLVGISVLEAIQLLPTNWLVNGGHQLDVVIMGQVDFN